MEGEGGNGGRDLSLHLKDEGWEWGAGRGQWWQSPLSTAYHSYTADVKFPQSVCVEQFLAVFDGTWFPDRLSRPEYACLSGGRPR